MDMFYIPALASSSGSASGTLASIVTNWVTQRRKDRFRHSLRATSQREELYKNFIEEASRLYADALVNDKSEVSKLVDIYALIACGSGRNCERIRFVAVIHVVPHLAARQTHPRS